MKDYQDKVIWITGASSGIGEELALAFSREGARLVISSRRADELQRVKQLCQHPGNVMVLPLNLEESATFEEACSKVIQHYGRIDVLVNNGGISQRSEVWQTSMEIERKLMEVNYFGNIALTKTVLPHFRKQKSGEFIIMSSIAGKFGFFLRAGYSASKHALQGYYESLRLEEEKNGIFVSIICPGKIKTPISVNAINPEGKSNGVMDHNQFAGLSAKECVRRIMKGLKKNKEEILVGGRELKAVKLKRFFPKLFSKIIRKQPAS